MNGLRMMLMLGSLSEEYMGLLRLPRQLQRRNFASRRTRLDYRFHSAPTNPEYLGQVMVMGELPVQLIASMPCLMQVVSGLVQFYGRHLL